MKREGKILQICLMIGRLLVITIMIGMLQSQLTAQRMYASSSVLATGNWYKIAVGQQGIYKIDLAFLNSLGINTSSISSATIRLFGNGGSMLPENNAFPRPDDLLEISIAIEDGGDGIFNGSDYFLFYAPGPHIWQKDSLNQSYRHQYNLYSNQSFYFISLGGTGKRILTINNASVPNVTINTYDEHIFHETDTINFLKSGKEWFGEEFSNTPGNTLTRSFNLPVTGIDASTITTVKSNFANRSIGAPARWETRINNQPAPLLTMPAVSGNFLESFAVQANQQIQSFITTNDISLTYTYVPGGINAQGWLNWFEVFCKRNLAMTSNFLAFRNWTSVGAGNVANFRLQNAIATTHVWEITTVNNPLNIAGTVSGNTFSFSNDATRLREYIAFSGTSFPSPMALGRVQNQNLHSVATADYVVITHPAYMQQAQRLAQFHAVQNGLRTAVVTTEQVYNEFASGSPDPTALRDYIKMYYDRAGNDTTKRPKYVLLFGDASFDYKNRVNGNTNFVPCYQTPNSLEPLSTYTSDDYFALLDNTDDINLTSPPGQLDVGIGRIPAQNLVSATIMVDKILNYYSAAALGPWRTQSTFVADDEDNNLHLQDAELIAGNAVATNPLINPNKIYLDAYQQQSGSGGSRYPQVNQEIVNDIFTGTLIWNYSGHGGSRGLADEIVLDQEVVRQFNNPNKLPLFITATCDFAPYDDPTFTSIGEQLLLSNKKGAIALTTTTRFVFSFSNKIINDNFLRFTLSQAADGSYLPLGEALRRAKNFTYNASGDIVNNRKFTLLGDPATTLAFPKNRISIQTLNGNNFSGTDTLISLEKYTVTGSVTDLSGTTLSNFNGTVFPVVYEKSQLVPTLGNDAASVPTTFTQQNNVVYKGKASVQGGRFSFTFISPKDLSTQAGKGKMSLYTENGNLDGSGVFSNFFIGGANTGTSADRTGPVIKPFLNDEQFVNGGITNEAPVLLVKLTDSSGINTVGSSIGHDITLTIDGNQQTMQVLNDYYEGVLDSYQQGNVRFPLPELDEGIHTLHIKAWDVVNNSSETELDFVVAKSAKLTLSHVLNYPNPFTTHTNFWFEHNQPASSLNVLLQVYSVSGKLVHQIQRTVQTEGNRSNSIEWDGKDIYNNKLGRGIYLYKLSVTGANGTRAEKIEKLYLL